MPCPPMAGPDPSGPASPTATGLHAGADLPPGSLLAGRFLIERLLGIGGMGVVYRAHDQALGITVALKLLRPELASRPEAFERFRQELLLARQVSSPHVVRIHDIARHEGRWFISMDFVDGDSLDKRLDLRGALPVDEALAIARQLAEGLAAAHAVGVVHRDLKPSNVLIDAQGNARISDFGVALSLGSTGLSQSGTVVGTPDYLSPEQARAGKIDGRSDLYALGLILYEMLAGQLPFGGTAAESLSQRLLGPPPPLSRHRADIPGWLLRLVDRLLKPNPAHRLPDANAVVAAIDLRAVPRDLRPGRRTAAALVLAAVVAGLGWWWQRLPATAPPAAVPNRLVVLVDAPAGRASPVLDAVAEHLRQGLSLAPGLVVVDGERTALAQAQAGFGGQRLAGDDSLLAVLPARRVLRIQLDSTAAGHAFTAQLTQSGGPSQVLPDGPRVPDAAGAARAFAERVSLALGAEPKTTQLLPADGEALLAYGQALQLRRSGKVGDAGAAYAAVTQQWPDYAAAWLGLAEASKVAGQRPLALTATRGGHRLAASPLHGELQHWLDQLEGRTEAVLDARRARTQAAPDDLDARLALAEIEVEAGEFESAIAGLKALVARDENDPRAWFLLGKASILHGDPRDAVENHLVRALVLYKRGRSAFGEAETTNAMGVGYARLGQTDDAEEQYRKALGLRRELGDRRGVASSLRNIAQVAIIRRRFDEAQASLDEARTLFDALGDPLGSAAVANELGLLAEERGDYQAALDAYRLALRGRQRAGDAQGSAESLNNIGFAHHQLGDYDNAQAFWSQARAAFVALDDLNGIVRADQNLGLLATTRGDWDKARVLLDQSLRQAQEQHMHEEAAVSHRNLAELDLLQSRLAASRNHVQQARALFLDREDQRGVMDADLLQTRLLADAGAHGQAAALLATLQDGLEGSSPEQRAIAALLQADLAEQAGRPEEAHAARVLAAEHGRSSGVRALQVQAQALALDQLQDSRAAEISRTVAGLGNLPLQLLWHERRMALLLAEGKPGDALADYASAMELLVGRPDYIRAHALHGLAARAFADTGQAPEAKAADTAARQARARLEAGMPPAGTTPGAADEG